MLLLPDPAKKSLFAHKPADQLKTASGGKLNKGFRSNFSVADGECRAGAGRLSSLSLFALSLFNLTFYFRHFIQLYHDIVTFFKGQNLNIFDVPSIL